LHPFYPFPFPRNHLLVFLSTPLFWLSLHSFFFFSWGVLSKKKKPTEILKTPCFFPTPFRDPFLYPGFAPLSFLTVFLRLFFGRGLRNDFRPFVLTFPPFPHPYCQRSEHPPVFRNSGVFRLLLFGLCKFFLFFLFSLTFLLASFHWFAPPPC